MVIKRHLPIRFNGKKSENNNQMITLTVVFSAFLGTMGNLVLTGDYNDNVPKQTYTCTYIMHVIEVEVLNLNPNHNQD